MRWSLVLVALLCAGLLAAPASAAAFTLPPGPARAAASKLPPIKNVWVIVLENKNFDESFGPDSEAPYLAKTLRSQGQLLTNYFGIGHFSLTNYIAMISGQAPNSATQADCTGGFVDVEPATPAADGQVVGRGCVYPSRVKTLANQLDARGLRWRGYMEDMRTPCERPPIGTIDQTQRATVKSQYAVRHNPFVYFRSIINGVTCARNDVPLKRLPKDVRRARTTPNFAMVTPDLCSDGHDTPCVDGRPGGLKSIDAFLRVWVPRILASPGFDKRGMLVITYDEAEGLGGDSSLACCNEPTGPNVEQPGLNGPGGGRTGALVISPWTEPGSTNSIPYNHYSLLRSVEDLFGLPYLGYAGQKGLWAFGSDVYNGSGCLPASSGRVVTGLRLTGRTLRFQTRRDGKVRIRVRQGGTLSSIGPRRVAACQSYSVRLPSNASKVAFTADGRRTVFGL